MKRYDKYLLREFSLPFMTILLGFVLLFVVFDFSSRLDDFIRQRLQPSEIMYF